MHGQPCRRPDHPHQGRPRGEHGDNQTEDRPLTHQPEDRSAHPIPIRPPQDRLIDSSAVTPHTHLEGTRIESQRSTGTTMVSQLSATLRSTRWKVLLCRDSDSSEAAPRHRLLAALPRRDEMSQRRGVRVPGRCLPRRPHPTTPAHPRTREPGWPGAPTGGLLVTPRHIRLRRILLPLRLPDPRARCTEDEGVWCLREGRIPPGSEHRHRPGHHDDQTCRAAAPRLPPVG